MDTEVGTIRVGGWNQEVRLEQRSLLIPFAYANGTGSVSRRLPVLFLCLCVVGMTAFSQPQSRTVQIFIDSDADLLFTNSEGQRYGYDFKNKKFVEEISGARTVTREGSLTFVIPYERSAKPYHISVTGRSTVPVDANLSMTGPGFVSGFHNLK